MKVDESLVLRLLNEGESSSLDYKRDQYRLTKSDLKPKVYENKKSELLKDILAFANSRSKEHAYILIGVDEGDNQKGLIIGENYHPDNADLIQFISNKTNKTPIFDYTVIEINGKKIGVLRIDSVQPHFPYYSENNYGVVNKFHVYFKNGTSTKILSPEEIEDIKKERSKVNLNLELENDKEGIIESLSFEEEIVLIKGELKYQPSSLPKLPPTMIFNEEFYNEYSEYFQLQNYSKKIRFLISADEYVEDLELEVFYSENNCLVYYNLPSEPSTHTPKLPIFTKNGVLPFKNDESEGELHVSRHYINDIKTGKTHKTDWIYLLPQTNEDFTIDLILYSKIREPVEKQFRVFINKNVTTIPISEFSESLK